MKKTPLNMCFRNLAYKEVNDKSIKNSIFACNDQVNLTKKNAKLPTDYNKKEISV